VKVTLSGRGFYAFERVLVIWNSTTQVARVKTDSSGSFLVKFKVPAGAPGEYTIEALAQKSFARASTSFQVTP
jgi:hypothetical protein